MQRKFYGDACWWRGKKLIEHIEAMARHEGYKTIGIGVGLYKDYGPAQNRTLKWAISLMETTLHTQDHSIQ